MGGGERRHGSGYWESGHIGSGNANEAELGAAQDSNWILLDNGTYIRRGNAQWSGRRDENSYGGVRLNPDEMKELQHQIGSGQIYQNGGGGDASAASEDGDHGKNSTGWVKQADGTFVRRTSAWSSWSGTAAGPEAFDRDHLNRVQHELETKVRQSLHDGAEADVGGALPPLPPNVEPGFEKQYAESRIHGEAQGRERVKRSFQDFEAELAGCGKGCTMMRCTIGPLKKDESVIFKIRSRLFRETQVKNYANKVKISSKLVTRVTRLPYQFTPANFEYQTHQVTTEVYPSELADGSIPWWVYLLAILAGIILFILICYCLYKCGFFKRKRPSNSPEREPLNGY